MTFAKNKLLDFFFGATFVSAVLICIATILPYFARYSWICDLFSHFRVQMVLCLLLASVLLLFSRVRKLVVIFMLFLGLHLVEIVPFYLHPQPRPPAFDQELSICLLNVNSSTGNPERVLAYLQTLQPDVIVIQEYSARWMQIQEILRADYPHQLAEVREDNFGMALLSKKEFISEEIFYFTDDVLPSLGVEIPMDAKKVFLLATHPVPPVGPEYTELRNRQLVEIGLFLADSAGPVILLGDLNTSPWSPVFKDLMQTTGLQNSMRGFGIQPTWPVFIPPLWVPLDHLLHSSEFQVKSRRIGPDVGSDHFPVEIVLQ